jgi:hypothetical protein
MATTGELREIIEELELIDIGDAATYLGEEGLDILLPAVEPVTTTFLNHVDYVTLSDCTVCQG